MNIRDFHTSPLTNAQRAKSQPIRDEFPHEYSRASRYHPAKKKIRRRGRCGRCGRRGRCGHWGRYGPGVCVEFSYTEEEGPGNKRGQTHSARSSSPREHQYRALDADERNADHHHHHATRPLCRKAHSGLGFLGSRNACQSGEKGTCTPAGNPVPSP